MRVADQKTVFAVPIRRNCFRAPLTKISSLFPFRARAVLVGMAGSPNKWHFNFLSLPVHARSTHVFSSQSKSPLRFCAAETSEKMRCCWRRKGPVNVSSLNKKNRSPRKVATNAPTVLYSYYKRRHATVRSANCHPPFIKLQYTNNTLCTISFNHNK